VLKIDQISGMYRDREAGDNCLSYGKVVKLLPMLC